MDLPGVALYFATMVRPRKYLRWCDQGTRVDPTQTLTLTLNLTLIPTRTQNRPETGEKRGCVAFDLS